MSRIVDSRIYKRTKQWKLQYLVQWAGYEGTEKEFTWEPADDFEHASEAVENYHSAYPSKPRPDTLEQELLRRTG